MVCLTVAIAFREKDVIVIFENSQAYPQYVVYYEEVDPFEDV
jgi:hypothetical protein